MSPARGVGWEPSGPYRRVAAAAVAVALVACLALAAAERYLADGQWGFPLDDSWIHLVFARSIAAGDGLAFNGGEWVSGSTAPLWTALVSLAFWLPGGPLLWVKVLGVFFHLLSVAGVARLAHRLDLAPWSTFLASVLTGVAGWLVWSSLSGLEIPLFIALATWAMVMHVEERSTAGAPSRSFVVLGAASLARPEGLLLLLLAVADRAVEFRRTEGRGLAWVPVRAWRWLGTGGLAALLLIVPVAAFNWTVGGSPLPSTYLAKAAWHHAWIPEGAYLSAILGIFFRSFPLLVLLAAAGVLDLTSRLGTARDRGLLLVLWCVGLPLAYGALSPPGGPPLVGNFGRYLFPAFPALLVLGCLGLEHFARTLGSLASVTGPGRLVRIGLLVGLVVWPAGAGTVRGAGRYLQSVGNVQASDVRIARWLDGRLPADAVLAVNDIGAIKYHLPEQRIVDLAGIVNPEVVAYRKEALAAGRPRGEGDRRFLAETRPDYLVIFPSWFAEIARDTESFPAVHQIAIPDNITMGGDTIAVHQTPWTRSPLDPTPGAVP